MFMGRIEGWAGGMTGQIGQSNTKIKLRRQKQSSNNMKVRGNEKRGGRWCTNPPPPSEISKFSTENLLYPGELLGEATKHEKSGSLMFLTWPIVRCVLDTRPNV